MGSADAAPVASTPATKIAERITIAGSRFEQSQFHLLDD